MKKRKFTARLKHFLVHVESQWLADGSEAHRVRVSYPLDRALEDRRQRQFDLKTAWEVLDLLDVVNCSNELVELLGTHCEGPAKGVNGRKLEGGAA